GRRRTRVRGGLGGARAQQVGRGLERGTYRRPGWASSRLKRFWIARRLACAAAAPSREDFWRWCQEHSDRRFSMLWSSPGRMWSTSVAVGTQRSPASVSAVHCPPSRRRTRSRILAQSLGRRERLSEPDQFGMGSPPDVEAEPSVTPYLKR